MLLLLAALCASMASGQPVSCREDAHCPDNYYCATDDIHICLECLSCQNLKREPPLINNVCIKSVSDCRSCFEGLVVDQHGDVNSPCVPPDAALMSPTPTYVWPLVAAAIVLVCVIVGLYFWRHDEFFKAVGSSPSVTAVIASAPEPPPPYNPYSTVRTESPCPAPPYTQVAETVDEERFIKPSWTQMKSLETDGNQAARPYNRPFYDRERSPTPEFPAEDSSQSLDPLNNIHDEPTVESPWAPDVTAACDGTDTNNALSVPELLAVARETTLVDGTPAKKKRMSQDTNNNRNQENATNSSSSSTFTQLPHPSHGGITFVAQINNVLQINKGN